MDSNFEKAKRLVADAAKDGAKVVLLPELMAAGYTLNDSLWDCAEPSIGGPTQQFLQLMALTHSIYIGMLKIKTKNKKEVKTK